MAVKNKKEYKVYLDEEQTEYVRAFLDTTRNKGGLSGVLNGYIGAMAKTLKLSGYKPEGKITMSTMLKMAINGVKQNPA